MSLTITTLTPANVQQNLQSDGLDTLGLATLALSTRWSDTTPAASGYDATALTLKVSNLRAPFRGTLEYAFSPTASTLAANLGITDTTLKVEIGEGNNFPSPTGGSLLLVLSSATGSANEVVECTSRSGDSFTITRGAANTTPQAFVTGDGVALRLIGVPGMCNFIGADGLTLNGTGAVFRLHPSAVWRLETLMTGRYATGGAATVLPVPAALVVRGAQGFTAARWWEPDESLAADVGASALLSFHDRRGLIVDPLFVASLFADLQGWLPGLTGKAVTAKATDAGGVQSIGGLVTGALVHFVDLHGNVYQPALPAATLITTNSGGTQTGTVPANGLITLAAGDGIGVAGPANAPPDKARLRWGWATNGTLARDRLVPPTLPTTGTPPAALSRAFYRVAVVDTVWALLGNRTAAAVLGIPGDDQTIPPDVLPAIRDLNVIDYLADGPDTLGTATAVLQRPQQNMVLAVSPVIDGGVTMPTQPGANAHWPAFPAPNSNAAFPSPPASAKDGVQAAWTAGNDVVVTIAADKVPSGAHVRLYPRQFVTIAAIAEQPSFVRGDGGAGLAVAGQPTLILLPNPFGLASGQPKPNPANLTMDIVVMPRQGARKMWGNTSVAVGGGPAAAPPDPFAGSNALSTMPALFQSVAPVPLFGIPTTVAPPGTAPNTLFKFLHALASETSPRQGPRLPTMARFETILATGTGDGSGPLAWEAVLTGGRWARETRSAQHASANPGNPAGPDTHAPGVHVAGALGYDLALHAMRRAQPIVPLLDTPGTSPGWIIATDGNNFNPPTDTTTTNTGIGVMLETVAAVCETPELSLVAPPAPGTTLQSVVNSIANALGVTPPSVSALNDQRVIGAIRRECIVSASGLRDAQWSLRRAFREARELIYIESPQFARTARPTGPPTAEQVDLVAEIAASLALHANLRVVICTPRVADFAAKYPGWSRAHYKARTEAVGNLLALAPDRVAVFHPVGFPGRPAFIRTTSVVVDDVWCLVGATHFRRRGMTFDGSVAIASFDRQMDNGYSKKVRAYRRATMAAKMAIPTQTGVAPNTDWVRLGSPAGAFDLVSAWLAQGGLGQIQSLWPGPSDTTVLPATDDMADPDGSNGANFLGLFASLIAEAGS
jgi:hypothetical protein